MTRQIQKTSLFPKRHLQVDYLQFWKKHFIYRKNTINPVFLQSIFPVSDGSGYSGVSTSFCFFFFFFFTLSTACSTFDKVQSQSAIIEDLKSNFNLCVQKRRVFISHLYFRLLSHSLRFGLLMFGFFLLLLLLFRVLYGWRVGYRRFPVGVARLPLPLHSGYVHVSCLYLSLFPFS